MDSIGSFDGGGKVRWCVMDRRCGRGIVARFESESMFAFHAVNAWQEESKTYGELDVVCEVVQYPTLDILKKLYYENLVDGGGRR